MTPPPETMLQVMEQQAKPRPRLGKQETFMCRLCGDYKVKLRKAHLVNVHKADPARMGKRSCSGMLFEIFGAPNL